MTPNVVVKEKQATPSDDESADDERKYTSCVLFGYVRVSLNVMSIVIMSYHR